MSAQYWIGGFFIDLSRNQITQNNQTQTLAPKALAVLTHLAENKGKVVSQDALLTKVWQDTAVSPNTLQKSIAQLRKALGEEGNVYIKTHAKQGYSLECDVRWQESNLALGPEVEAEAGKSAADQASSANSIQSEQPKKSANYLLAVFSLITAIIVLGVIGFAKMSENQAPMISFGELRAVTSTDNQEIASIYSPDGDYIVFHRYSEEDCVNSIWAKNIDTKKEIKLTKDSDAYGRHSFSKDGKRLVFIRTVDCEEPLVQKKCYQLMSLDFHKALESPQPMQLLLECKNSEIKHPHWLNNNNIAMLQKHTDRWQLISYSIDENKSNVIHSIDNGNIVSFDYSSAKDLIAVTSIHGDGKHYIETLTPEGQLVSSHKIQHPREIHPLRLIYPRFASIDNQLLFSTGRQLFTLATDGRITNISLPLDEPMGTPVFHPNGKQMLAIKGYYDSDIIALPLAKKTDSVELAQNQSERGNAYSLLERSSVSEDSAIFQPEGELLAFVSERSGDEQIWIDDGEGTRQLTDYPMDTFITGLSWAEDGHRLMANVSRELRQINLDGTEERINLSRPVETLYHWDSQNQTALANVLVNGVRKFAEINLANSEIRIINDKQVKWARRTQDGQIIYTDQMDRFWRPGPIEDQLIESLQDQGSKLQFVIKGDVIYGVNEDFQLWSYSLEKNELNVIGDVPNTIDKITDVNQNQVIATLRIASRKDVVELLLRE